MKRRQPERIPKTVVVSRAIATFFEPLMIDLGRMLGFWWCDHCKRLHWADVVKYRVRLVTDVCSLGFKKGETEDGV